VSQNDEQTRRFQRDLPASHDHHMQAQQTGKVPLADLTSTVMSFNRDYGKIL